MSSEHSAETYKVSNRKKSRNVHINNVDELLSAVAQRLKKIDIQNAGQIVVNYNVERNSVDIKVTVSV